MDNGRLTDHHGKTVDFRNVILIMTTNAGAADMASEGIGFGNVSKEDASDEAVKRMFTPEFRNRLDAIVPFGYLPTEVVARVVDKFILQLELQLADRNVHIELDDEARAWLTERGYDRLYGARPMGRLVQEKIKQPLAEELLFGKLIHGGEVKVRIKDNAPSFEIIPAPPKASKKKKKAAGKATEAGPAGGAGLSPSRHSRASGNPAFLSHRQAKLDSRFRGSDDMGSLFGRSAAMTDLTFYTNPMSRGRIVRWMLEEVGEPYETVRARLRHDDEGRRLSRRQPDGQGAGDQAWRRGGDRGGGDLRLSRRRLPGEAGLAPPPGHRKRGPYYRWLFFAAGPVEAAVTDKALGSARARRRRARWSAMAASRTTIDALERALAARPLYLRRAVHRRRRLCRLADRLGDDVRHDREAARLRGLFRPAQRAPGGDPRPRARRCDHRRAEGGGRHDASSSAPRSRSTTASPMKAWTAAPSWPS